VAFTDYRKGEFGFSPAMRNLKLKDGWAKWGLRKAVHGLTHDDIIWRRDRHGRPAASDSMEMNGSNRCGTTVIPKLEGNRATERAHRSIASSSIMV